ncbi:hypothetical protein [Pseudoduganella sp. GCM10020061]|uniref:hypothetical protein n=1 Tax=Pseudoduganella sp. GCM10020061 TaxID=3317345 RepID=UPI00363B1A7A
MTSTLRTFSPLAACGAAVDANSPFSGFRKSVARSRARAKPGPEQVLADRRIRQLVDLAVEERLEEFQRLLDLAPPAPTPLETARQRGVSYMKAELDQPDNLTLGEAAAYCGRSDRVVNEARQRGDYYALVMEGNSRGFRYPRWQFDAPHGRLAAVLHKLDALDASCWSKHHFLTRPSPTLHGRIPRDIILDQHADLGAVCLAIDEHFSGEQGAA